MKLTEHFSLKELTATSTGYNNMPPNHVVDNLHKLAVVLEKVRSVCGDLPMSVSSGYRSPDVNNAVGGAKTSAHVLGLAADFTVATLGLRQVFDMIRSSGIVYDQLILEPRWIHLGLSATPRQQNLIYDGKAYTNA
jgi:uncharacterized protein YcbK (DUF882 family)